MTAKRKTRKTPPAAPKARPPVDRYKRLMIAVALAPTFAAKYLRADNQYTCEAFAASLVQMADAIARRLEKD